MKSSYQWFNNLVKHDVIFFNMATRQTLKFQVYLALIYVFCQVDMYSLGVIFFELWHPFATAMERHLVLSDLKQKGDPPLSWESKFPRQSVLLRSLLSPSPSNRPSAVEVLQNELPPRMEDEWLNGKPLTFVYDIQKNRS
jgi:serine/threonine protein kinase